MLQLQFIRAARVFTARLCFIPILVLFVVPLLTTDAFAASKTSFDSGLDVFGGCEIHSASLDIVQEAGAIPIGIGGGFVYQSGMAFDYELIGSIGAGGADYNMFAYADVKGGVRYSLKQRGNRKIYCKAGFMFTSTDMSANDWSVAVGNAPLRTAPCCSRLLSAYC